ncbi:MAG: ABC transporter substrate-binding protein [Pseudomonadota bacterium]
MKSFMLFVLSAVLLSCTISVCCAYDASFRLKLATQDFQPFSYLANPRESELSAQKVAGPAAEIIHSVCSEMGTSYVLSLLPWRRAQYDTREAGIYHGLFLIGWNQKRSEWLYFSPPILQTEYGFFVTKDNPMNFKQGADLKGYTIGVFGPSNTSKSLEKIKSETDNFIIDMRPDDISGFKKLSIGRVNAVYSNKDVGFAILVKNNITNVRYAGMHKTLDYFIGFDKKNTPKDFVDEFNNTFIQLYNKKIIQGILEKYQMTPAAIDNK